MTTLTKLLPPGAAPAKIILERAGGLVLTSAERAECPKTITTAAGEVSVAVEEMRQLEVGDVFVDDAGAFLGRTACRRTDSACDGRYRCDA